MDTCDAIKNAAKPAGAFFSENLDGSPNRWLVKGISGRFEQWDPVNDDGDSFRLLMAIEGTICTHGMGVICGARYMGRNISASAPEQSDKDRPMAVRYAVLRVAAEIGQRMP